jgi:NAD(P)-dependent dehydrogenase (short-subunit alcohol dehydrogenase family)
MTDAKELAGKTALVTGGSGGIGSAIVHALQQAGATAASLDVSPPSRPDIPWLKCDVRSDSSVESAVKQFFEQHKRLDSVIHAAGVSREAVVWKLAVEDWDFIQSVNLRGAFLLLRHSIPLMRKVQGGGRVVLIGSINGSRGKFGTAAYSASKAGLLGLAKSVARETGRFGITVNVIEPGWVRTPLTDALPKEILAAAERESALGTLLDVTDIAAATLFLCGPGASRMTGQILRVDAGQFLGGA